MSDREQTATVSTGVVIKERPTIRPGQDLLDD